MSGKIVHNPAMGDSVTQSEFNAEDAHIIGGEVKDLLATTDVDDTPENGATTSPVSSNWAFDHAALTNAHGATATPTANKIPLADADGTLNSWVTGGSPTLDAYGAGAYPYATTIGPVGGGLGYVDIMDSGDATATITTTANFLTIVAAATSGGKLYIANGAHLDFLSTDIPANGIVVAAGVTIYSTRGNGSDAGAILHCQDDIGPETFPNFLHLHAGARLTGLQIIGPYVSDTWRTDTGATDEAKKKKWTGIDVAGDGSAISEIDNCVIDGFSYSDVTVSSADEGFTLHHCEIDHANMMGYGYGVEVLYAVCTITANIFSHCRHCISGARGAAADGPSYTAQYNIFDETNNVAQCLDWHGGNDTSDVTKCAGVSGTLSYNTFKNVTFATGTTPAVSYVPTPVSIRGFPLTLLNFHHNWFYLNAPIETYLIYQSCANVSGTTPNLWLTGAGTIPADSHVTASENWIGTEAFPGGVTGGDMPRYEDFTAVTLATGVLTVPSGKRCIEVTSESGATNTLVTISDGYTGQIIILKPTAGDDITIDHNAGNVWVSVAEADVVLDADDDCLMLIFNGSKWATL
jgi:hypothetical protein